jgi:hypothetical protein
LVAPALLSISSTATIGAPLCGQGLAVDRSYYRAAHARLESVGHAGSGEICGVYIKQFVEAVTSRQAIPACPDGIERQRALQALDAEIEIFNDRIAEHACAPS